MTVIVEDGMLSLKSVDIDAMWVLYEQDIKMDEIELGFSYGDSELKIKVELDEGQLKKSVDIDMDD